MNRKEGLNINDENIRKIRASCLILFEQSVGYEFRVKGTVLIDYVAGVDWQFMHVCGEKYGNFHIDYCELTGSKKLPGNSG